MKFPAKKWWIPALVVIATAVVVIVIAVGNRKKEHVPTPPLTKEQKETIREVTIPLLRYEQDLFQLDVNNLSEEVAKLYGKYPDNLIAKDCWKDPTMMAGLKAYLTDPTIKSIYEEVEKQYGNMDDVTQAFLAAYKIYLTHFPDTIYPKIYTLVPGLDFQMPSVFIYDNDLFINLDMYLGKDYKLYQMAGMPKFISARCERPYIATDCFTKALAYKHLPEKTLLTGLDNMIYEGKRLFFTQTMFPNKKEQEIIGYSDEKMAWIKEHQRQVWQYFVEKEMLFSKDDDVIRRLVDETPFTRDFGNNSPGRLGSYIGWQIVKSFMKNNPETTLEELMKMTDSQKILKASYYKP